MVEGQIFGEEELLQEKQQRQYTAICESSEGELYAIHSQVFLQKIYNNHISKHTIQELLKQKNSLFDERMNQIQTQFIENQSPRYIRTNDFEQPDKNSIGINTPPALCDKNEQSQYKRKERLISSDLSRTLRGQYNSPQKGKGECDKVNEINLSPLKQLESSAFGINDDTVQDETNINKKKENEYLMIGSLLQQKSSQTQIDLFSIEVDEKQKVLIKQRQKQNYAYKNYLKSFDGNKFDVLLKKTGYKRIDKDMIQNETNNGQDCIKIKSSVRQTSLDKNYQNNPCNQIKANNSLTAFLTNSQQSPSSKEDQQFQMNQKQQTNHRYNLQNLSQYQYFKQEQKQNQRYNNDQNINFGLFPNLIQSQQNTTKSQTQKKSSLALSYNLENNKQSMNQQICNDVDQQCQGRIMVSSLFQNQTMKNKNILQESNQLNFSDSQKIKQIKSIGQENNNIILMKSHNRKLKTESNTNDLNQKQQQNQLCQSYDFVKDKLQGHNNSKNTFDKSDDQTSIKSPITVKEQNQIKDGQQVNIFDSWNNLNQIENNINQMWRLRCLSTRRSRTPVQNTIRQSKDKQQDQYKNEWLEKFNVIIDTNQEPQNILPNFFNNFQNLNQYKIPSTSLGVSRKNSPPQQPKHVSSIEQRSISSRQGMKKNIFLNLHLQNYEQALSQSTKNSILIKNIKSPQKFIM